MQNKQQLIDRAKDWLGEGIENHAYKGLITYDIIRDLVAELERDNWEAFLKRQVHYAKEVYHQMDKIIPETAPEAYLLEIIEEIYRELQPIGQSLPPTNTETKENDE